MPGWESGYGRDKTLTEVRGKKEEFLPLDKNAKNIIVKMHEKCSVEMSKTLNKNIIFVVLLLIPHMTS